jgi:hypothetical protein
MARRKLGRNPEQVAKIEKLHKQLRDRKNYYKREYGDTTLLEVQTKPISSIDYLTDFRAYVKTLENAIKQKITPTHKRNKHGVMRPISEINEIKKEYKRINKMKAERRKQLDEHGIVYQGKIISVAEAIKAGDKRFEDLAEIKFNYDSTFYRSNKDFENKMAELHKDYHGDFLQRWDEELRNTYLKALKKKIGVYSELGTDYTLLREHIENMNINDFMKLYYTREFANIVFLYDKAQAKDKLSKLLSEWELPQASNAA